MTIQSIDDFISQTFPNGAPPGLADVAMKMGNTQAGGSGVRPNSPLFSQMGMYFAKNYVTNLANSGDLKSYYNDALNYYSTAYSVSLEQGKDTSQLSSIMQQLVNTASSVGIDPQTYANSFNNNVQSQISAYNTSQANRDTGGGFLDNLISAVTSPQGIATLGLTIATGGSSLALTVGEMAMGATADEAAATVAGVAAGTATATAGAATVGAALVGSATSATLAAISGGDVTKSAIAGAISGGTGANASDIANALTNNSVADIAASTGLTAAQVSNTITNAVTTGVVTAAVTGGDVATAVASSLASSGVSAEVQNTINNNLPDMSGTAKLVGNVAGVATKAAVSGTDIGTAIQSSIPQIIGGQLQDTTKTDTTKPDTANTAVTTSQTDTGNTAVVVTTDPANNTALVMSTDGNVSVVATTDNIPSGSTVKIDPTTNVATVTNVATTGTTFAPTASADTVVSDVTPSPDLVKQPQATIDIGPATVLPQGTGTSIANVDSNSPTGFSDNNGQPINPDGTPYTPETPTSNVAPTVTTPDITPTVVPKDTTGTANTTQQVIDLISSNTNAANVVISTGTDTGNANTATANLGTITGNGSIYGTGNANVGIIGTQDNAGNVAAINQTGNVTISTGNDNLANANVTITDNVSSNISNNAATTTKTTPSGNALTSALSPSIIPSKSVAQAGIAGPSTAYLGQALGTVSPDSALSGGGTPVFSGEEGKKRNVWNIESLRNALGI